MLFCGEANPIKHCKYKAPIKRWGLYIVAEKEGFEPSNTLWVLHDFQSCALGRTTRLLRVQNNIKLFSLCIIMHFSAKVKNFL